MEVAARDQHMLDAVTSSASRLRPISFRPYSFSFNFIQHRLQ